MSCVEIRRWLLACFSALLAAGCAAPGQREARTQEGPLIIVAVAEGGSTRGAAGAGARADYRRAGGYNGSDIALDALAALQRENGLAEVDAWTISTLNWRCALLRPGAGADAAALLQKLAQDPRVALAQPLNQFETLSSPAPAGYNDPYLALQTGFAAIDAAGAQRASRGDGVTVALIDTALDPQHPDLQGRLAASRDFAAGHEIGTGERTERHATEVAGIIAASANNGIGIVGVAPGVRLLPLRACWGGGAGQAAHCNSFTLARALAAALAEGPDIVNLSLAGPRDALLEKLLAQLLARRVVVVGAVPPGGLRESFPAAVPGVLAVAAVEDGSAAPGVLAAPGKRVLTLAPGGGYDYASGSSMAAAHVSGVAALLRALDPKLDGAALQGLLAGPSAVSATPLIDACVALQRLRPGFPGLSCAANLPPH